MPSVLITGASGFIGSFLAEEGLKRGYTVYAGVRATSSRKYLRDPRLRFLEMELNDERSVQNALNSIKEKEGGFGYIIHNAGVTKVSKRDEFEKVNRDGTIRFVDALFSTGTVPSKFLLMSSLAAWGPGDPATMEPVRLTDTPRPAGLYGASKLAAEEYVRTKPGLPYIILRPTGVFGPRERDYFTLYRMIGNGMEPYLGTRDQLLTFIYVKDLARAAFDALESPLRNRAWFVSDGNTYTAGEFAEMVKSILRKKTVSLIIPLPAVKVLVTILEGIFGLWQGVPMLSRDKYHILSSMNWNCDPQPLFNDLSFRPEYDLRMGLEETLRYCRESGLL